MSCEETLPSWAHRRHATAQIAAVALPVSAARSYSRVVDAKARDVARKEARIEKLTSVSPAALDSSLQFQAYITAGRGTKDWQRRSKFELLALLLPAGAYRCCCRWFDAIRCLSYRPCKMLRISPSAVWTARCRRCRTRQGGRTRAEAH